MDLLDVIAYAEVVRMVKKRKQKKERKRFGAASSQFLSLSLSLSLSTYREVLPPARSMRAD